MVYVLEPADLVVSKLSVSYSALLSNILYHLVYKCLLLITPGQTLYHDAAAVSMS